MEIFSVYDASAGFFMTPFFARNVGSAWRSFEGAVRDPGTQLHQFHASFSLYVLGSFDDEKGEFTLRKPEVVGTASQILAADKPKLEVVS